MKKYFYLLLGAISLLSCAPWTRAQGPARNTSLLQPRVVDDPNYVIGAEDMLAINVWKEPEISSTVPVRTDGKISLPLLNDVQAAGLTPNELGSAIQEKLRKTIVDPQVTVIVTQINSRKIYVLGQVTHGGAFSLASQHDSVASPFQRGWGHAVREFEEDPGVIRAVNGRSEVFPINYKEVVSGSNPRQNIALQPGDTIVVP